MTFPTTIHTAVGESIIGKVSRWFNGGASDVLTELLQNARRAGATKVHIDQFTEDGQDIVVVRDDGKGIDDPATLLTLGDSGWQEDIARREDPAGMGMFSLAGRQITVRSWSPTAGHGWQVTITPDAWESSAPLAVEPCSITQGTEIRIAMPDTWQMGFENAAKTVALYYPLPVLLNGEKVAWQSFLNEAERIEEWNGCRIGIVPGRCYNHPNNARINFHGLTVPCDLPEVAEIDMSRSWYALVEIVDAPALQLVLPARKEMVQNSALEDLREECEAAIYRTIARKGHHRLPYKQWLRARSLGVDLPEAEPWLPGWLPRTAETEGYQSEEPIAGEPLILLGLECAPIEQCLARALVNGKLIGAAPVRQISELRGYRWYDALPRVVGIEVRAVCDAGTFPYSGGTDRPDWLESGRTHRIDLKLEVQRSLDPKSQIEIHHLDVDAVVIPDDCFGNLDHIAVLLAQDAALTPEDLAALIEDSCFDPSDDCDADSWDTQHREFETAARYIANELLLGENAATIQRIRDGMHDHICWLLPKDCPVAIHAIGHQVEIAFANDDPPALDAAG